MYTINIRGKQNPKDTKMVKLEIIFFKTGYARVPKVINITGLLKDWDVKSQSFRVGSAEATTKNKLLSICEPNICMSPIPGRWKAGTGRPSSYHIASMKSRRPNPRSK